MARVSLQGSNVEGKIECTVGSGDIRLLRAKSGPCVSSVQGSDVECKAAMWRQKEISNVVRGKEQQQLS